MSLQFSINWPFHFLPVFPIVWHVTSSYCKSRVSVSQRNLFDGLGNMLPTAAPRWESSPLIKGDSSWDYCGMKAGMLEPWTWKGRDAREGRALLGGWFQSIDIWVIDGTVCVIPVWGGQHIIATEAIAKPFCRQRGSGSKFKVCHRFWCAEFLRHLVVLAWN